MVEIKHGQEIISNTYKLTYQPSITPNNGQEIIKILTNEFFDYIQTSTGYQDIKLLHIQLKMTNYETTTTNSLNIKDQESVMKKIVVVKPLSQVLSVLGYTREYIITLLIAYYKEKLNRYKVIQPIEFQIDYTYSYQAPETSYINQVVDGNYLDTVPTKIIPQPNFPLLLHNYIGKHTLPTGVKLNIKVKNKVNNITTYLVYEKSTLPLQQDKDKVRHVTVQQKDIHTRVIEISNITYHLKKVINDWQITTIAQKIHNHKIEPLAINNMKFIEKFGTLYMETSLDENKILQPCKIVYYLIQQQQQVIKTYDINSYKNRYEMYKQFFQDIINLNNLGYKFYCHNLSHINILGLLSNYYAIHEVNLVKNKENNIVSLLFTEYEITWNDSYLILPDSISNLTFIFDIENNESDSINKAKTLYNIIKRYYEIIEKKYQVDITKYTTLAGIAMAIYRTHYIKPELVIESIKGTTQEYHDIKQAYQGGKCEIYKKTGTKLYHYDINSLYPYIMKKYKLPCHNLVRMNSQNLQDYFGFVYAKVTPPTNQEIIPFLMIKQQGILSPVKESLYAWYFSEELKYAQNLGYQVTVINGYTMQKEILFKDYVTTFYKLKTSETNNKSERHIAKLMLNSLYGKFGMDAIIMKTAYISQHKYITFVNQNIKLVNVDKINQENYIIDYIELNQPYGKTNTNKNINIAISAAISAYARMEMYTHMQAIGLQHIYYIDTDALITDRPLPKTKIGKELGEFKLINKIDKALFITPKLYVYQNQDETYIKAKGLTNQEYNKLQQLDWKTIETLLNKNIDITTYVNTQ